MWNSCIGVDSREDNTMTDQTILITGASRGLGAATARIAAQMGANVALMARSVDELEAVAQEVSAVGVQALPVIGDVRHAGDCQRAVQEVVKQLGHLDAVVNNTDVLGPIAPVAHWDPEGWQENWVANVLGPVLLTQAALPYLRQRKGRVINVSSGAAVSVIPGWAAYSVSKAALNHWTRALAQEEPAITAIAFRPGVVDTAMQAAMRHEEGEDMSEEAYTRFLRYYEEGKLLPPAVPGCSLAVLALEAPHEWTGAFLPWNSEEVLSLVRSFGTAPCAPAQEE
jgi:NAD(P)-dependent dehydrogenase (short-subunit alcohol dehydrogenase family)